MSVNIDPALVRDLQGRFPRIEAQDRAADQQTVLTVPVEEMLAVLAVLRCEDAFAMDILGDLTAVDYPDRQEVVYQLSSLARGHKLTFKVSLTKPDLQLPSVTDLWPAANFSEREVYDLLGVVFIGHPNLTRILLPDDFAGHPLRKDYSLPPRPAMR